MFTFGRDHEKKCALQNLRDQKNALLISTLIDAIHDLIEQRIAPQELRPFLIAAFSEGSSGVWEQSGSWLRKLGKHYPELCSVWIDLSSHPNSKVRFRAACCIDDMPPAMARETVEKLCRDTNKKVRDMAIARGNELSQT